MICVVGAVALDIIAIRDQFVPGTSNPAEIRFDVGGVGYRIYRGLATEDKRFVTAVGRDYRGGPLEKALGSDHRVRCRQTAREHSAVYMAMMESGDLRLGASDMSVIRDGLDFEFAAAGIADMGGDDFLVLEANLSPTLVARLLEAYAARCRVVFEAVSVEKAREHASVLRDLYLISATTEEAAALLGVCEAGGDLDESALRKGLVDRGNHALLVTRGSRGATLYTARNTVAVAPPEVICTGDTTGAGDRLLCRFLDAVIRGESETDGFTTAVGQTTQDIKEGQL